MKCHVCGGDNIILHTVKSALTGNDTVYCQTCLMSGFESYTDLVAFGFDYDMFSPTFQQKIVNPTIRLNKKSIEQFNEDVYNKMKELEDGSTE